MGKLNLDNLEHGVILNFAICENCKFELARDFEPTNRLQADLKETLFDEVVKIHDQYKPTCTNRKMFIFYSQIVREKE